MKQITIEEFKKFLEDHLHDYVETVIKECEKNKDVNTMEWIDPLWNKKLGSPYFSDLTALLCMKTVEDSVPVDEYDIVIPDDSTYDYIGDITDEYVDRVFAIVKDNPRYKEIEEYNESLEWD